MKQPCVSTPKKTRTSRPKTAKRQEENSPQQQASDEILSLLKWLYAFSALPADMLRALTQQFPCRVLSYRELGQNSGDAGAREIFCVFRMENVTADGFDFVAEWLDDGCGMNRNVLQNNYLDLLHSSKNDQKESVGRHGAGRLAILAIPALIEQETLTVSCEPDSPGFMVRMHGDGKGEVFELDREAALERLVAGESRIKKAHGTLVRIRYRMAGGEAEFAAETQKINQALHQELRFIRPRLTVTTVKYETPEGQEAKLVLGSEVINQPLGIPGRLSKIYPFELGNGGGKGVVYIGIRPDAKHPLPDLTHLTLTSGGIPLERDGGANWCRNQERSFNLESMRIIIESYDWNPPIGRHKVRHDAFYQEIIPKVWEKIILRSYIPYLSARMADRHERRTLMGYYNNLETMLFDLLNESAIMGFDIPDCVAELPLFPRFGASWERKACSVRDLEKTGQFYFTTEKPDLSDWRGIADASEDDSDSLVLDLSYRSYYAIAFLERKFGSRAERVHERFLVKDDSTQLGSRVNSILQEARIGSHIPTMHRTVRIARFVQLGSNAPDTSTRSHASKDHGRISLNASHPDVQEMMKLAAGPRAEDRFLGTHFLLREALLADGLDIGERDRRQALQRHTASRFDKQAKLQRQPGRRRESANLFDLLHELVHREGLETGNGEERLEDEPNDSAAGIPAIL